MATDLTLSIDKGTSVVKCLLFDNEGRVRGAAHAEAASSRPSPGLHEEDPEEAFAAIAGLVRSAMAGARASARDVKAIGVTAHMGGLVLLDGDMRPVHPNVIWDDTRAAEALQAVYEEHGAEAIFEAGGNAVLAGLCMPLLRWFRERRPEVLRRARHLCAPKDYLVLRLTGALGTDESDAGWMPGDVRARGHSAEVRRLFGVEDLAELFPPVRPSHAVVGGLLPDVARTLGLLPDTPVVAGLGDANAGTVGVGAVRPGQGASIVGTSLLNNVITAEPVFEPRGIGFISPTVGGRWMRMLPNTGGGSVNLKWLVDLAYRGEDDPYGTLEREAGSVPPGAHGVFYHPYVNTAGVVAPFYHLGARAQFTGIFAGAARATVARAVLEGVAYAIRDCFEACPEAVTEVRLSGGAARSALLCRIVADVLGRPVVVPEAEEATALGAAIVAGCGTGLHASVEEGVERCVAVRARHEPDPDRHAAYEERFPLFRRIRETMGEVWTARLPFER